VPTSRPKKNPRVHDCRSEHTALKKPRNSHFSDFAKSNTHSIFHNQLSFNELRRDSNPHDHAWAEASRLYARIPLGQPRPIPSGETGYGAANEDGSWNAAGTYRNANPTIDTCFALLFLKKANFVPNLTSNLREYLRVRDPLDDAGKKK
jgi:hypothetical protein